MDLGKKPSGGRHIYVQLKREPSGRLRWPSFPGPGELFHVRLDLDKPRVQEWWNKRFTRLLGGDVDPPEEKTTIAGSIAVNLARLRMDRQLTRKDVAVRAGLSEMAVRQIERGSLVPLGPTVDDLAKTLAVPVGELVVAVRPLEQVRFPGRERDCGREQIQAAVSTWLDSYTELQTWLDRVSGGKPPHFRFKWERTSGSSRTPVETAQDARQAVGLGSLEPVCDLARLLEDNGVKLLLLKRKQDPLFGLSIGPGDRGPAVVVNASDRSSVEGWIFAAARELGHLLLHPSEYGRDSAEYSMQSERDADHFASEFLMPDAAFAHEWETISGNSLVERVLKVKRIFRVSYKVVLLRLVGSGRRPSDVWRRFQRQYSGAADERLKCTDSPDPFRMNESGWPWNASVEPAGMSRRDFAEKRLSWLVSWAVKENAISLGRAAEILQITREDLRKRALQWVS